MTDEAAREVLGEIARASGRRFGAIRRFEAGENRSTWRAEADGAQLVLKLDPPERLGAHERAAHRAFDLATLLFYVFYAYDAGKARDALWAWLRARRPTAVIAVYFAHVILRQVEWSLRLHAPEVGQRYLDRAHRVLRDLGPAGG